MAKFCNNCGAELSDDATFCNSCGAQQNAQPVNMQYANP